MKNTNNHNPGFTLIEIMIVVAIIGLLAAIAIPNFLKSQQSAEMNVCICNLRSIQGAKQQWALEQRKMPSATPIGSDLQPYLGDTAAGSLPSCPLDGARTFATSYAPQSVGEKPLCQIVSAMHILP
ncbi:MAG TPA: prepilin-type N-terminal cleavage/methylation domain-containing protein [Verrucomicrobiae bacterium]|jgi:prepilin-type N-terminal cleavage/methylation domain-containing protein|nr:prepilin-type N-terminal cleavage/methylation domain-containing protein [Verrucomicrobiae bacterium]